MPKSRERAVTLEDNTGTSSLTSQSRLVPWANDCNVVFFEKKYFNLWYLGASVILKPCCFDFSVLRRIPKEVCI